ncbi:MAG: site-2 protease family protein [bacterium]|nr:MAG: site-2 protease family protein [bacterium]
MMRDVSPVKGNHGVHITLFLLTLLTTTAAGALQRGNNPLSDPLSLVSGLPFSLTLMTILGVHEMGHYLTSHRHRVPATLPYFIPAPSIIGTFGALIRMKGVIWDRRTLLDIGVSGPLAGFLVALPALAIGFLFSEVLPATGEETVGFVLGDSLIVALTGKLILGNLPHDATVVLHPVAFAGWIGLFVTSLNLLPVGQLDGGHIAKAMFPVRFDLVARIIHLSLIAMGIIFWEGWLVWALVLIFIGVGHPPVLMDHIELDPGRRKLGFIALAIFVLTFVPAPFRLV